MPNAFFPRPSHSVPLQGHVQPSPSPVSTLDLLADRVQRDPDVLRRQLHASGFDFSALGSGGRDIDAALGTDSAFRDALLARLGE